MIRHSASLAALCRHAVLVGAFGVFLPIADAQTAPAPTAADLAKYDTNKNGALDPAELAQKAADQSNTVVLSPFEVSTEKDVGYAAGNTLSGGRVDTPLEITPGSISVMTKEFMDDFNVTNMNDAGSYMIGFDLGTPVPNSNPSSESVYQNIVRGASSTDNFPTRNGSINFGAADSYNTERFEFQRGPDTAMFGDGGPGGRQGSSSKRVRFSSTATSLSGQFDNWNGYRATLDYNKGWDRFGLRFNALTQNAPGYQDNTNKLKNAATLAASFKIGRNTVVSAEYERVSEWNNLWSVTNGDAQNGWDGVTVNNDNSILLANNGTSLNAVGLERMVTAHNGNTATNMFVWNFATNTMMDYGGNQYRTRGVFGPNMRIPYEGNPHVIAIPSRRAAIPGIDAKFNVAAKDNVADRDADTTSINVEHRVGNIFLRGGFVKNSFDNNTIWSNTSPNAAIIDVNRLMPNGALNPRFLRYFTDVTQDNIYSQDATQEFFGQASYRFFKPQWWDYKQMLSLNLRHRDTQSERATRAWRRIDNPTTTTTNGVSVTSIDPFNNSNRFIYRVYWGDPRPDLSPILTDPNGKAPGKWAYVESGGNKTERGVRSLSLTSQSTFFSDNLSFTLSYSRDKVDVANLPRLGGAAGSTGAAGGYKNVLGFNNTPGRAYTREETVDSKAIGVVTYPFRNEGQSLLRKSISPLGFVVNYAENNQPPSTGVQNPLIDGTEPELTHSKTMDFGLRYSIRGGKAYLNLTTYKTDQIDNPSGFGSGGDITQIWAALGYTDPALITTTAGSGFAYSDPRSLRLEGWEAELVANPTSNITLSINYGHPRTYIIKDSEARKAYVAEHRKEWETAVATQAQGSKFPDGRTMGDPTIITQRLQAIDNSLNGLTTGTLENGATNHRINANAAYSFREGTLRGLRVVAGVQYRSHQKAGSRDTRLKFNIPDSVPNNQITVAQNTAAAWDYLWVPPNWKHTIQVGANYTRRFGQYTWRFQLNVTNILNELSPIFGRSGPTGGAFNGYNVAATNAFNAGNPRTQFLYSFVNPDPRKITFTTTVSF
jgi:iron complex outermembrane recepter protein